jgi:hypothetical protein
MDPMSTPSVVFAYFSPETMLPLSSIVATLAGFALLVRRSSLRFAARCIRAAMSHRRASKPPNKPHFRLPAQETSATAGAGSNR